MGRWDDLLEEVFEFEIVDVKKHLPGRHDQSQHGRKGSGKVPADKFRSVLEQVKAQGGLSVKVIDGSTPQKGYMVALGGNSGDIVSAKDFYDPEKGQKAVSDFLKKNKTNFANKRVYLGIWHNTDDGNVYLDVSENILDRATAISAGESRDQISIWDVVNLEEIGTGGSGSVG